MFSSDNNNETASRAAAPIQAALGEIRLFASQLQEMTALFSKGRNDMARQLEAANQKMEAATNAISMGEARIAAQIAAFEKMTNDARRATEEHDRAMRNTAERMHQVAMALETDAIEPIKVCAENIQRSHEEAVRQIDLSHASLRTAMDAGEAKLAASTEALDSAAGAMAQNVVALLDNHNTGTRDLVSILAKLDGFVDAQSGIQTAAPQQSSIMASELPELNVEREAMKRLTVGYRMMMRDVGKESQRLEGLVGALESSIAAFDRKLEEQKAAPAPMQDTAVSSSEAAIKLPNLDEEKTSFQRLSVGFRLLLQDISSETERLRGAVDGVSKATVAQAAPASNPPICMDRIESLLEDINRSQADLAQRLDTRASETGTSVQAPDIVPQQSASALPKLSDEKDSLQRILVGFRLLLKEISNETGAYRAKVAEIKQPDMLVLSPSLEPELLAPLNLTAERIAEGIAESLSMMEQKLSDPLALLNASVGENIAALKLAHSSLAEASQKTSAPTPKHNAPSQSSLSVADAVKSMERAAALVDQRVGSADQLLTLLKKGGAMNAESLRELVMGMNEAASALRSEAGDLLAIGASLHHDLTSHITAEDDAPVSRRTRTAGHVKKRMF
ncbi:MAG: hypothetical protein ACRCWF_09580 [Beijerinckiaceae bacterium]